MKRDRAWRRYMKEKHTIRRLNIAKNTYFYNYTLTRKYKEHPLIHDFIGTYTHYKSKSYSTDKHDSKYKNKYSPNKTKSYRQTGINTREYRKKEFLKILKENGIR